MTIYSNQQETKTRLLNVTVTCQAVYNSSIAVPANLSFEDSIAYAKAHLDEIPLGALEYISGSDELDEENCDFEEFVADMDFARSMKAVDIDWDVNSEAERDSLPSEIEIPEGMMHEEDISNYLSDVTGFCHKGFKLVDCSKEAARDMGGEPKKPALSEQIQSASTRVGASHASPDTPIKSQDPER